MTMMIGGAVTEVARADAKKMRKRFGRLGVIGTRRRGPQPESDAVPSSAIGYRTLSKKLAPSLVSTGGVLAIAGGLGTWIRTSNVKAEGLAEEQVRAVMGYEADWGRVIAGVGALAAISGVAWLRRGLLFKLASVVLSLGVIGLAAWRLPTIESTAAQLAIEARTGPIDFVSFHAGLGWGAWLLLVACVVSFLGVTAGLLRELDVRKGIGG